MPDCVNLDTFGGAFLQPVADLTFGNTLNLGQMSNCVIMLQSYSALQVLNCSRCEALFTAMQGSLQNLVAINFAGSKATSALNLLTGFADAGLFQILKAPDLNILATSQGKVFLAAMQDLLGTNYAANVEGLIYLKDTFRFLGYSTSSSEGVDLDTTLEFPPSFSGGLLNFGFLEHILQTFGDNIGLEEILKSANRLLLELEGQAWYFHDGELKTPTDLDNFNTLVAEMQAAGILMKQSIVGFEGLRSMTNMIELLSTFAV